MIVLALNDALNIFQEIYKEFLQQLEIEFIGFEEG